MRTIKLTAFLTTFLASCFAPGLSQNAQATTMTATLCTINVGAGACPAGNTLDFGVRSNGVPLLGINRWAMLPFSFQDANAGISGNVFVVDIAGAWIYLYGLGVANGNNFGAPVNLQVAITQDYLTTIPAGTFIGVDTGFCNAAATAAGSGQTGFPFVNGNLLAGGGAAACPAIFQTFGPQAFALTPVTNLTAIANFSFGAGGGQLITLPWGDDFPLPGLDLLNNLLDLNNPGTNPDPSPQDVINTLNSLGFVQQVPEPATLALFGAGLLLLFRRRKAKA